MSISVKNTRMHPKRDLAIVLRSVLYEERHKIVTALTQEHGQITAMAKNSVQSRRFGGTLEPFAASEWAFTLKPGSELYHLTEAQIREPFEEIRKDFIKFCLASAFNELLLKLAPQNEVCLDLFRLHSNALSTLNEAQINNSEITLLNAYLAKVLQWSGSQPRLYACIQCNVALEDVDPNQELTCIIANAGWICSQCRHQEIRHIKERDAKILQHSLLRLKPLALQDFQLSLRLPIRQILLHARASSQDHKQLFQFIEALYVYHLPGFDQKPLKTLRFLGLESSAQPALMTHQ